MNREELSGELYDLNFYSALNRNYHQKLVSRWGWRDRFLKITLGIIACVSFATSAYDFGAKSIATPPAASANDSQAVQAKPTDWLGVFGLATGFASLVAAVVLNIVPFDRKEQDNLKLLARWNDFNRDVLALELRLKLAKDQDEEELAEIHDRLTDFIHRRADIEIDETPPERKLVDECEAEENLRRWGFAKHEDAIAERDRRRLAAQQRQNIGPAQSSS